MIHKTYKTEKECLAIIADMEAKGFTQISTTGYFIGQGHLLFERLDLDPPHSIHPAKITGFDVGAVKPLSVVRVWEGRDYFSDCFITQTLKDEFIAGNVIIGDWVIVLFDDEDRELAMMKVYKTW